MPALTDMEHRLAGPQSAQERQAVLDQLADLEHRLRQQAARQLPPEDHQQVAALAEAAQAARQVVRQWPHPGSRPGARFSQPL